VAEELAAQELATEEQIIGRGRKRR